MSTSNHPIRPEDPGTPACAVVLVCWNNKSYLDPCLRSLFDSGMHNGFEVVVVDNGSTDGSQQMLRERYPTVRIVQNDRNVGLGKASNQGIECTTAPFVLLLNNDTIVNGASLDALIDFMRETSDAAAVGGTLLNEDGSFQSAYNHFPSLAEEFMVATRLGELLWPAYPARRNHEDIKSVDWLGSACLLVRRAALERVGPLDEEYFIYGDEADLQFRFVKAGWKMYHLPHASTVHFGGRSLDRWRRRRMVYRGKLLFYRKNYGVLSTLMLRSLLGALTLAKVGVWSVAWALPGMKVRAGRELQSNADVLRLCVHLD